MPFSTGQQVLDAVSGMLPATSDTTAASIRYWLGLRRQILVTKELADAAASTASTIPICSVPSQMRVVSARFIPGGTLTANDTNFATLALVHDDGAAGSTTTIATMSTTTTDSGSWAAKVGESLTLTAANAVVAAGRQLMLLITKPGTGVVVPAGTLEIVIEPA